MIYQLKVQLKDIRPPVWRRLLVPSGMTFAELHDVLQKAFDWEDRHLHTFYITKTRGTAKLRIEIGNDGSDGRDGAGYKEHKERLSDWLVEEGDRCLYIYDFGDDWEHELVLEKIMVPQPDAFYPVCLKAVRVAPEEDSMGVRWNPEEIETKELTAIVDAKLASLRKETGKTTWEKVPEEKVKEARATQNNVWRALLEKAVALKLLAPWQWMDDDEIFLVIDPETNERLYCSVIGALGQEHGMVVYIGEQGYESLRHLFERSYPKEDPVYTQRAVLISFVDRNELSKEDYELLRSQGMTFRGKKQWPQFRSFIPGYYPWTISEEEAKLVTTALDQALDVAQRVKEGELSLPVFPQDVKMFARVGEKMDGTVIWRDDAVLLSELEGEKKTPTYELLVEPKLMKMVKKIGQVYYGSIEFDAGYINKPVQEKRGERPYFPIFVLAVDVNTGFIIHSDMLPIENVVMRVQKSFLDMLLRIGKIPREIRMKKETKQMLAPVLRRLPIRTIEVSRIFAAEHIRRTFEMF
ncbi:plasmid pRiA4b ORF-3 family protein [Parageobacillus thermoglucosidasius]|uniref:Plasmid pRiA4b ORF-3 family protein n=1 Tax=Parageobacillus thermoglucosidasius TaxID=1426 RepID=A0AB38QVH7_PARTM|nr:plasmid pRiA4b ORF-3 family protein [Parageobacillus thermoglucosidasius]UOE75105.1 plasmid pRiA4b ORF-3 family protein [Parageobacillus thermoglucosidasius]